MKKKEYIYYSCTNAKKICKRQYIKEEIFLDEIGSYFEGLRLSPETIDAITLHIKDSYDSEHRFSQIQRERLNKEGEHPTADQ